MLTVQKDIGLVGIDQTQSIVLSRLVDISHDVTQAESQRLVAQAKLITMQSAPPDVLATLSGDPVLLSLKQRMTELQAEYASLNAKYGAKNPRLVEIRSELDEVTREHEAEQAMVLTRAQEEVNAATQNQNALQRRLDQEKSLGLHGQLKGCGVLPGPAGIRIQSIAVRRAATAAPGSRHHRRPALHQHPAHRLQRIAPDFPSSPRKSVNLMLGLLSGLGIGLLLSFLVEALDTNIKTIFDIEERLGLPMLGVVPQVDTKQLSPETFVRDATSTVPGAWSRLAEAYRSLRTTILLSRAGTPPQVILISSAKPSEGKTSITTLEAIVFALNGARVLLIDSDLRRPSVHLRFRIANKIGLTSVLTGKSTLQDAIVDSARGAFPAYSSRGPHCADAGRIAGLAADAAAG